MKNTLLKSTILFLPFVSLFANLSMAADTTPAAEAEPSTTDTMLAARADRKPMSADGEDSMSPTPAGERYRTDHCFVCQKWQQYKSYPKRYAYPATGITFIVACIAIWAVIDWAVQHYRHWQFTKWVESGEWRTPDQSWSDVASSWWPFGRSEDKDPK